MTEKIKFILFIHEVVQYFSSGTDFLIDFIQVPDQQCGCLMCLGVEAIDAAADTEGGDDDDHLERDEADQYQHDQGDVV